MSKDKVYQSQADVDFSGTTLNSLLVVQNSLYICNVGDSRSVLYKDKDFSKIVQLSQDHKPNLPEEKNRIQRKNGVLRRLKDSYGNEIGPLRVYIPRDNIPGLAMTRSIGDLIASKIGITWKPNINYLKIQKEEEILIVIATDGIWDVLNNQQVINILKKDPSNLKQASQNLQDAAISGWKKNDLQIIDDITFIIVHKKSNQNDQIIKQL